MGTKVEYKLLCDYAKPPEKSRETDVGYDVFSSEEITIAPLGSRIIPTGIAVAVPPGFYYTVEGRSSMFLGNVLTSRGIIDSGYCGELKIHLTNMSRKNYKINVGDKIAQIILHKQYSMDLAEIEDFGPEYSSRGGDGTAGWGSSGK